MVDKEKILEILNTENIKVSKVKDVDYYSIICNVFDKYIVTIYYKLGMVKAQPITEIIDDLPVVSKSSDYYYDSIDTFKSILKKLSE